MTSRLDVPIAYDKALVLSGRLTFEEFLTWTDEDIRAEWVDGEVILMSPASAGHQRLVIFLARLLAAYIETHHLGELLIAPFLMHLPSRPSGREPDLLFLAIEHADRLRETYVDGPADLAIEIVSPESERRDRDIKLGEYESGGVQEYWLIDALRREALFYQLGADARYHSGLVDPEGVYRSRVLPGFSLRVDWLWQHPLPRVSEILQQTGA